MPIYNLEKYLYRCLNSIEKQNYKDIEVLLIDDGSTDNSKEICEGFTSQDKRFSYIRQNNAGVSNARNTGLKSSHGEYITFVDGDDFLDEEHIKELVCAMGKNVDLVVSGRKNITEDKIIKIFKLKASEVKTKKELVDDVLKPGIVFSFPWNKLFKADIILSNNILFDENLAYGEDLVFNIRYISKCQKGIILNNDTYNYVNRDKSVSKRFDQSSLGSRITDLDAMTRTISLLNKKDYKDEVLFLYTRIAKEGSKYYCLMKKFDFSGQETMHCKSLARKAYSNSYKKMRVKERLLFRFNLSLPKVMERVYEIRRNN